VGNWNVPKSDDGFLADWIALTSVQVPVMV
jgi:hypothetical protein